MWRLALVLAAVGCGRVGFEARTNGGVDGAAGDGATTNFVVSATALTGSATFSWVDLDVDWSRSMAYMSSRETGTCFAAVDFSSTPTIVRRFGPADSSGTSCLGVSLDATGTQLLVASEGSGRVELWDLGADPRTGAYTRLGTIAITGPRRISRDFADPNRLYIVRNSNAPGLEVVKVLTAAPWLAAGGSFDSALACADSGNDATALANGIIVTGCSTDGSPVEIVDGATMSLVDSIRATPSTQTSGFWSATRSADGSVGALTGWVGVIVTTNGNGYTMSARFDNDDAYRGMTFANRGSGPEMWAARSDGQVDVLSIAAPDDPVVIGRASLGVMGEAYALRVDPSADRMVIVTNRGFFVVARPSEIDPVNERWPAF